MQQFFFFERNKIIPGKTHFRKPKLPYHFISAVNKIKSFSKIVQQRNVTNEQKATTGTKERGKNKLTTNLFRDLWLTVSKFNCF